MEIAGVTAPFGRRAVSLGMLASQALARTVAPEARADKWKLYRALCEARAKLGISDRALSVLNALMSFYPKSELAGDEPLVVFPSNAQLSLRTHGMAETTLRRHLAALVEAGLLLRRDSPNGKRYARRDGEGAIDEAFGFSLAPLLARAGEIETLAAEVTAERLLLQRLRERLTLVRRDIAKLIATGLEEDGAPEWLDFEAEYRGLMRGLPRVATGDNLRDLLARLEALRELIVNRLERFAFSQNRDGNADQNGRHIQNSNTNPPIELEPRFETKPGGEVAVRPGSAEERQPQGRGRGEAGGQSAVKPYPLALVLQACPEIVAFGPGGEVRSWRDLMTAAVVVRSMLGVSPSAYEEACAVLGPESAATVIACILERAGHINSAGGYLRDLTRRAERGEFSLGPMLMSLARARGLPERRTG
ncbi:plasmid replication protein RepC [Shinella pollutisoli]|uniref:Plasmid replication protein RepC n=1 Tax=Shinella pollutisoli TaxID=2250594 RepID=A0ABV7DKZ2_9HYPH|nr:plasmid replication protein RepC [Shinella pollutisoli]